MRVGLVIYGSLDTLTGGYLYDRKLAEHLSARGDDVEIVSLPWRSYGRHLCDNASPGLARRLDRGHFDVLVQDELNHPSLVLANRRLRRRRACPVVTIVHVLRADELRGSPLRPLYEGTERRYLAGVDGAVFCCQATRDRAERVVGASVPGVVVHPGCDHVTPRRREPRAQDGPLRVVSVSNVVPRKGAHVLIEALARLPSRHWRLTVVGSLTMDPAYVGRVRRVVGEAGVGASVRLVGAVANEDVPRYLADADVLVVPSSYEGLAIAYVEAMRCGLPVIATTAGGANEVVEHGREGWLVDPGDVAALTGHLELLLRDPDLLRRMSVAARRRGERHPSWSQSLELARDFLCSVRDEHRSTRGVRAP
jgi:glycosyltransferase involved in cell wall biosynthesis